MGLTHTNRLRKSAGAFHRLTGISPAAFDRLLADLEPRYAAADARRKARPDRQRNPRRRHTRIMKNVAGLHNLMFD